MEISTANATQIKPAGTKVFVGGLSWETTTEKLRAYFLNWGEVLDAFVSHDRTTGRPRGFGFVIFKDADVATKVIQVQHTIDRRTVEAKRAVPKDETDTSPPSTSGNVTGTVTPAISAAGVGALLNGLGASPAVTSPLNPGVPAAVALQQAGVLNPQAAALGLAPHGPLVGVGPGGGPVLPAGLAGLGPMAVAGPPVVPPMVGMVPMGGVGVGVGHPAHVHGAHGMTSSRKIFIGGLPSAADAELLREYFSQYGTIIDSVVMYDSDSRPRGFGFITFEQEDAVERVLATGTIHVLFDKKIEVKRAVPREQMSKQGIPGRVDPTMTATAVAVAAAAAAANPALARAGLGLPQPGLVPGLGLDARVAAANGIPLVGVPGAYGGIHNGAAAAAAAAALSTPNGLLGPNGKILLPGVTPVVPMNGMQMSAAAAAAAAAAKAKGAPDMLAAALSGALVGLDPMLTPEALLASGLDPAVYGGSLSGTDLPVALSIAAATPAEVFSSAAVPVIPDVALGGSPAAWVGSVPYLPHDPSMPLRPNSIDGVHPHVNHGPKVNGHMNGHLADPLTMAIEAQVRHFRAGVVPVGTHLAGMEAAAAAVSMGGGQGMQGLRAPMNPPY